MANQGDTHWVAAFSVGNESHHLMVLQGEKSRGRMETAIQKFIDTRNALYPNLGMKIEKLELMESPGQVDKMRDEIRAKFPRQLSAVDLFPGNPNALLFQVHDYIDPAGYAEEALIRRMVDGIF